MEYKTDAVVMGIDVGGTGIKGAPVDVERGALLADRHKMLTPQPVTPEAVAEKVLELVQFHKWDGPIGVGFPAIVKNGVALSAANIDKSWIGVNIEELFSNATGMPVKAVNDADAAGVAEVHFGSAKDAAGTVVLITIGSGLGSALFVDGILVPNTEFGHLELWGDAAEKRASNRARESQNLSWEEWGGRFNEYLHHIRRLLSPDLVILGGGVSKAFAEFSPFLDVKMDVRPAEHRNGAGTIGAACYAYWAARRQTTHRDMRR